MEEDNKQTESEAPRKNDRFNSIMLKVLMLVIFALMMGMCSIKYIS